MSRKVLLNFLIWSMGHIQLLPVVQRLNRVKPLSLYYLRGQQTYYLQTLTEAIYFYFPLLGLVFLQNVWNKWQNTAHFARITFSSSFTACSPLPLFAPAFSPNTPKLKGLSVIVHSKFHFFFKPTDFFSFSFLFFSFLFFSFLFFFFLHIQREFTVTSYLYNNSFGNSIFLERETSDNSLLMRINYRSPAIIKSNQYF